MKIAAFFIGVQNTETRIKKEGGYKKWKIGYQFLAFWEWQ
jgi:hypothetical protein